MRLYLYLMLPFLLVSDLYAAQVVRVLPNQTAFAVTLDSTHTWIPNDVVCVTRGRQELACGYVVKVGPKGALVRVSSRVGEIAPGDTARMASPTKIKRNPSSVTSSYGVAKTTPNYSDINLTAGLLLGSHYLIPAVHFDVAISDHFSLGVLGGFSNSTDPTTTTSLSMVPIIASVSYFSDYAFSGIWVQLGAGIHLLSAQSPGINESANSLTALGTVGYRYHFRNGINIGGAVGGEYISLPQFQSLTFNFPNPQAIILFDLGFNF